MVLQCYSLFKFGRLGIMAWFFVVVVCFIGCHRWFVLPHVCFCCHGIVAWFVFGAAASWHASLLLLQCHGIFCFHKVAEWFVLPGCHGMLLFGCHSVVVCGVVAALSWHCSIFLFGFLFGCRGIGCCSMALFLVAMAVQPGLLLSWHDSQDKKFKNTF